MHPHERIEYRIGALKGAGLWRDPELVEPAAPREGFVDARSNDYLGLAAKDVSRETAGPIGAGASRLISGNYAEHRLLERELADWLGFEDCLIFSSGYAANVGLISALAGPGETVLSDALNHASIIDGCRLSRADVVVLPHRDVGALEKALAASRGVRWVVTESYFGMDGDSPDLPALRRVCDAHGAALIVDEAHAIGVFGPGGRGVSAALGTTPDVLVGGMGKALGIHGGFVACSRLYRGWLWNRARSLVFSTAPSPLLCSLALGRVHQVREADAERARLRELELRLVEQLRHAGVETPPGRHGPLFPVVLGSEQAVLAGARRARELGVLCHPIRPPTVPRGASRLRVTLRADMSEQDVDALARALASAWTERSFEPEAAQPHEPQLGIRASDDGGQQRPPGALVPATADESKDAERTTALGTEHSRRREDVNPGAAPPRLGGPSGVSAGELERRHSESRLDRASPTVTSTRARGDQAGRSSIASGATTEPAGGDGSALSEGQRPTGRRWVVLGTGTGVGKTFVARAMVRSLAAANEPVAGLKPVETGLSPGAASDAATLAALALHVQLPSPHPLYGFEDPVTPSRAARARAVTIDLDRIARWAASVVATTERPAQVVVETAGGVFSPLSDQQTNFDLSVALEPATWILVAPNRLGVLHDVTSTLLAMTALGRRPDWIILSAPDTPDSSTSSNREELRRLPSMPPVIELPRNDERPLEVLLRTPAR